MAKKKEVRSSIKVNFTDVPGFYAKCLEGKSKKRIDRYVEWKQEYPRYSKQLCSAVDETHYNGQIKESGILDTDEMEVTQLMQYVEITSEINNIVEDALHENDYDFFKVRDDLVPYVSALDRVGEYGKKKVKIPSVFLKKGEYEKIQKKAKEEITRQKKKRTTPKKKKRVTPKKKKRTSR